MNQDVTAGVVTAGVGSASRVIPPSNLHQPQPQDTDPMWKHTYKAPYPQVDRAPNPAPAHPGHYEHVVKTGAAAIRSPFGTTSDVPSERQNNCDPTPYFTHGMKVERSADVNSKVTGDYLSSKEQAARSQKQSRGCGIEF